MISAKVLAPYINIVIKTAQKKKNLKQDRKILRSKFCTLYVTVESLDPRKGSAFCYATLECHSTLEIREVTLMCAW